MQKKTIDLALAVGVCLAVVLLSRLIDSAFQSSGASFHSVLVCFMAPLMKTVFFATVQRKQVGREKKHLVWIAFCTSILGIFIGTPGLVLKNDLLGTALTVVGLSISLLGFLPLQKAAQVPKQETEQ